MREDSILDARGQRELQPILNIFGILFAIIIIVIVLDKVVQIYIGQLSYAAHGVIIACFLAFLYFTKDYFKSIVDGYLKK